jgi:large subunit ribosomal protein L10
MLTKQQKTEQVKKGTELLKKSQNLVFADFTGVNIESLKQLKKELKKVGADFRVIKKRLLKIALKEMGIDFDPVQFEAQVGTIFIPNELTSAAAPIYKFSKELTKKKIDFKILGAYDLLKKLSLDSQQFTVIAKLPSREILLAQLVGVLAGPIKALMYVLEQKSKKVA